MTLGVYLLGALDPAERFAFESHLSYCEICRGELVRLAPLPGMLNQIAPEDFADDMPPTGVEEMGGVVVTRPPRVTEPAQIPLQLPPEPGELPKPRKQASRRSEPVPRKRFGRVLSAAAAVVVLAVGAVFGWQAIRHDSVTPGQEGVVWSATSADGTARAEARLIDHEWGTELQMKLEGLPPGRGCYVMVYDHYGNKQVGGWWGTDHDPDDAIPGSVWIRRSKIDRLDFMLDDRKVALTIEAPR
jgi:hypothetical protein